MERLPGLLAGDPVYWIETLTLTGDGGLRTELGFSDVAANPYERLVAGTAEMLRRVPGVAEVIHEDREVVLVTSRGLAAEHLADLVDRYWFHHLPTAPVDAEFEAVPGEYLASPWPSMPPPPRGALPEVEYDDDVEDRVAMRLLGAVAPPPSRARMWTYLVCGAIPAAGGIALAAAPGGNNGLLPLALGAVNLVIATRIALQRRRAATAGA